MSLLLMMFNIFADGSTIVYTLSGTSLSPNVSSESVIANANAQAGWRFKSDGTVWKDEGGVETQLDDGNEWTSEQDTPTVDIWIRASTFAGSGDAPTHGAATGSWLKLQGAGEADYLWDWRENFNGFATTAGTLKIELSTDSGGVTIVATGYYKGSAVVEE